MVASCQKYAILSGIRWNPPKYEVNRKLPFIPLEREIDVLIACCGKKMSVILQLLKETTMRIGETLRLEWTDVDFERRIIVLNNPEKHGNPRAFKMSEELMSMLNRLIKDSHTVFGTSWRTTINNFSAQRKNAVRKLGNSRLLRIHFHTLRHWKATMEYHRTKDILYVMKLLGHKSIANTLIYTQLVEFEGDEYSSAVAHNVDEAKKLIEAGFEYVCNHENVMIFRKRK
jgi:integrase